MLSPLPLQYSLRDSNRESIRVSRVETTREGVGKPYASRGGRLEGVGKPSLEAKDVGKDVGKPSPPKA